MRLRVADALSFVAGLAGLLLTRWSSRRLSRPVPTFRRCSPLAPGSRCRQRRCDLGPDHGFVCSELSDFA